MKEDLVKDYESQLKRMQDEYEKKLADLERMKNTERDLLKSEME